MWFASALALTEALAAIDRLTDSEILRADLEDAVRRLWDHLHVVPVDQRCLDEAARLARERPIRLTDAIHLAAAAAAPGPVDASSPSTPPHLAPPSALGCEVVAP